VLSKSEIAAELIRRRKARSNLQDFICYINPEYIVSEFSRSVCKELDEFIVKMAAGKRPILVLGAPPQHGKSDIVSRYLPAYFFGHYPDQRVAGLSYSKDLASDMNRDVQRIMLGNEYRAVFPSSHLNARRAVNVDVEAKRNSETFEIVGRKGTYIGQGVGGPLTGKKVDLGIIDDPIKNAREALSSTTKGGIWKWYVSTFLTRLSKNSGQIIMATRWAVDDLSGEIIKRNSKARALAFKAIDDSGAALVPDLHPIDKLLETKEVLGDYFWSAMYQQSPIVMGGNLFKTDGFKYYTITPKLKWRAMFVDTAQKTKEQNDFTVFQVWGETYDNQAIMLDQLRGKWEAPMLLTKARTFWNKHKAVKGSVLRSMNIEDKVSGTGLIQTLKLEGIPVKAIQRNTDKIVRAMDVSPLIASGNVLLPEGAEWVSDYLTEFAEFPNGKHDDQVDPTMDALIEILGPNVIDYSKML